MQRLMLSSHQCLHIQHLPARIHHPHTIQPRRLLHSRSNRIMGVSLPHLITSPSPSSLSLKPTSLAEIATIILCTCFPMMPRLVKLLRGRYFSSAPSLSASRRRPPWRKPAKASTSGGTSSDAYRVSSHDEGAYERLGEEGHNTRGWGQDQGIQRTVDIELATRDQGPTREV